MTESPLTAALAKFHKSVGTIHKSSKAQYGAFASLADVLSAISAPLSDAGLAVTQTFIPTEGCTLLRTTLRHTSGETVDSDVPLITVNGRNALHDWGGAVTYIRRFSLLAALNLAAGIEDDDGDSADSAPAPAKKAAPAPAKTVKPSATPTQKAATPKPSPEPAAEVEPPIDPAERQEILQVLKSLMASNRTAFDAFVTEYRATFNLPEATKLSDHLQERQHADFAQQFFASLPPA
jgi:hypothetical protein